MYAIRICVTLVVNRCGMVWYIENEMLARDDAFPEIILFAF